MAKYLVCCKCNEKGIVSWSWANKAKCMPLCKRCSQPWTSNKKHNGHAGDEFECDVVDRATPVAIIIGTLVEEGCFNQAERTLTEHKEKHRADMEAAAVASQQNLRELIPLWDRQTEHG